MLRISLGAIGAATAGNRRVNGPAGDRRGVSCNRVTPSASLAAGAMWVLPASASRMHPTRSSGEIALVTACLMALTALDSAAMQSVKIVAATPLFMTALLGTAAAGACLTPPAMR